MPKPTEHKNILTPAEILRIIEAMEIGDAEIMLLLAMKKKFRYGTLTVMVRNGRPAYVERVQETYNLEAAIRDGDLTEAIKASTVESQ